MRARTVASRAGRPLVDGVRGQPVRIVALCAGLGEAPGVHGADRARGRSERKAVAHHCGGEYGGDGHEMWAARAGQRERMNENEWE